MASGRPVVTSAWMRQDKLEEVGRLQARSGAERRGRAGAPRIPNVPYGQEEEEDEMPRGKQGEMPRGGLAKSLTFQAGVPRTRILKPKP